MRTTGILHPDGALLFTSADRASNARNANRADRAFGAPHGSHAIGASHNTLTLGGSCALEIGIFSGFACGVVVAAEKLPFASHY